MCVREGENMRERERENKVYMFVMWICESEKGLGRDSFDVFVCFCV